MPSPPAFLKKPPTAPRAALALSTPVSAPADPPDYAAQLNSAVKRNEAGIITVVLCYPAFASALLGYVSSAKALPFPLPADRARYLGSLNLVSTRPRLWLPHLSYLKLLFQTFADLTNFPRLAMQTGLLESLTDIIKILGPKAAEALAGARSFISSATALIRLEEHRRAAIQRKREADEAGPAFIPRSSLLAYLFPYPRNAVSKTKTSVC